MDDNEDCFIQIPKHYDSNHFIIEDQTPLFSSQNAEYQNRNYQDHSDQPDVGEKDQVIDEELLAKISQLHQTLRNKKLLQFQLIESRIMKRQHLKDCRVIQDEIQKIKIAKAEIQIQNRSNEADIQGSKQLIEAQKHKNREYLIKIEQLNYKTMKAKLRKEQLLQKNKLQQNKNDQDGFISVQKIRLQAENKSKHQIIQQIKSSIRQIRAKLAEKQQQNTKLQQQQQLLMKEIKKQEKLQIKLQKRKASNQSKSSQKNAIIQQIHNSSICEHQKENSFNLLNLKAIHNQNLKSNKSQVESVKRNTEQERRGLGSVVKSTKTKKKVDKFKSIR